MYGLPKKPTKPISRRSLLPGDIRRGQSLVVWAISEGRECARKVDEFLSGGISLLESRDQNVIMAV